MRVQRANALSTGWLVSLCPAMAATMMAEAFGFQVGEKPSGVILIHHDAELLAESLPGNPLARYPHQFRGATHFNDRDVNSKYAGKQPVNGLQPTASMNGEWSLILRFDHPESDEDLLMAAQEFLKSARLAGGSVVEYGDPVVGKTLIGRDGPRDQWGVFDRSIGSGFVVADRSPLLQAPGKTMIESLLSIASGDVSEDGATDETAEDAGDAMGDSGEKKRKKKKRAWYSPATLGYAMLTPFEKREYVRENKAHAFCEPVVGLIEYLSVRSLGDSGVDMGSLFWHPVWLDDSVFVVTQ
jgi:CRISPR-associated protein Csy2